MHGEGLEFMLTGSHCWTRLHQIHLHDVNLFALNDKVGTRSAVLGPRTIISRPEPSAMVNPVWKSGLAIGPHCMPTCTHGTHQYAEDSRMRHGDHGHASTTQEEDCSLGWCITVLSTAKSP